MSDLPADDPRDALAQKAYEWLTEHVAEGESAERWRRAADSFAYFLTADGSRFLPAQAAEQDAPEPLTVEALAKALRATRDERYVLGHQRDRDVAEDEAAVILAALPPDWPHSLPDREALANDLYVRVVNPDLTWWDDLTPEMQAGWLRAADWLLATAPPAAPTSEQDRLAAIGAAVERLPQSWLLGEWDSGGWGVFSSDMSEVKGVGDTVPEAIAASLDKPVTGEPER